MSLSMSPQLKYNNTWAKETSNWEKEREREREKL